MGGTEVILTHQGIAELERALDHLKSVRRQEIAEQIKKARAFGDISENAEYDEAKNEQAKIEGEINYIENTLRNAKVIEDDQIDTGVVNIGTKVKVIDLEYQEEIEYTMVGSAEANATNNKISNESPVGSALIGASVGETVEVPTPGGNVKIKILGING